METRSMQEVFNIVSSHLLTQKERCMVDTTGECKYRLERDGKVFMCAVGCLIPDELYQRSMEGVSVKHLIDYYHVLWPYLGISEFDSKYHNDFRDANILTRLQKIHDSYPPDAWKNLLKEVAKKYNLVCKYEIFGEEGSEEESIGS